MADNLEELPLPDELPVIPDDWRYESLGDLVDERGVSYGIVQPGRETTDGVPIVRVNNIRNGRIDTTDMLKVGAEVEAKFRRSRLRGGEVLLTLVGTLGEVAIVPDNLRDWNVARAVGVIPVRKDPGCLWVSICLRSAFIQHCIRTWATTTVQATFNLRDLAKLPIPIPPAATREAIAAVLGALDDKIELNRRMNATLEAMARALFQSWFVDFDPVRAKLDGRPPAALDPAPAALFPEHLEDSPLGHIPKGWTVRTIESVCSTVTRGVTPEYEEGTGRFIINQRVNRGSDLDWSSLKELSQGLEVPPERFAKRWDVLVNCLGEGTLGRTHLYKGESDIYAIDQHMSICRAEHPSGGAYIYQVLSGADGQAKIESLKTGSTGMTMFNISKLRTFELVWPSAEILAAYFKTVEPLWLRITNNDQESRTLATLRDTLLPKLLSGELSVAETVAKSATVQTRKETNR